MWMAVEIKSVGGLHWPQEWLPNPSKNCITVDFNCYSDYCGFQLLSRSVLYYSVLLLTKLYFKQHVQWIIKRQNNMSQLFIYVHCWGWGGTQSSLCCIDCKIDYRDVKFEMRVPAVDLTVKWFLRCSPNMLQWTALITVMVITSFKYILAYK